MKKFLVTVYFLILSTPNIAFSKPVWEIADTWVCKTFLHTKIKSNGDIVGINESSNFFIFDFENLRAITGYSEDQSSRIEIIEYIKNDYISENIFKIYWKDGDKGYYTIEEKNGKYFWSATSGHSDSEGILWSTHYFCNPQK
jgi:hypothetical protein